MVACNLRRFARRCTLQLVEKGRKFDEVFHQACFRPQIVPQVRNCTCKMLTFSVLRSRVAEREGFEPSEAFFLTLFL